MRRNREPIVMVMGGKLSLLLVRSSGDQRRIPIQSQVKDGAWDSFRGH